MSVLGRKLPAKTGHWRGSAGTSRVVGLTRSAAASHKLSASVLNRDGERGNRQAPPEMAQKDFRNVVWEKTARWETRATLIRTVKPRPAYSGPLKVKPLRPTTENQGEAVSLAIPFTQCLCQRDNTEARAFWPVITPCECPSIFDQLGVALRAGRVDPTLQGPRR